MIIGLVTGNVWATRKEKSLNGLKLMVVKRLDAAKRDGAESDGNASFVAVDCVGAGVGERVLVVFGSSARKALENRHSPVDAAIIGILDEAAKD